MDAAWWKLENHMARSLGLVGILTFKLRKEATSMSENDLRDILDTMNLPEERKDTKEPFNVRWLSRNMRIENKDHPQFEEARAFITILLRRQYK